MNSFDAIQPLWESFPSSVQKQTQSPEQTGFGGIFKSAINDVIDTDREKNEAEYLLATGQMDNPSDMTIATTKAQLSVELLVQLRNRALDSYNELIRMSL